MKTINTLGDYVDSAMAKHGSKVAYQCTGCELTYSDLEKQSRKIGYWLQSKLEQGDRVAIQLPNINQYPLIAMAVVRAGMVLVNTNPLYTPREMQHQFSDSGAKAVFILSSLAPKLTQIIDETPVSEVVLVEPTDLFSEPEQEAQYQRLYDILQTSDNQYLEARKDTGGEDIAMLQYTGGTTGVAKGACLTHANILNNIQQTHDRLAGLCVDGEEVFVCPLPLYHIYAFTVNMIYMFGKGNRNILIPNPRDLDGFVNQIKDLKFTGMSGINTLFVGLSNHPEFKSLDFSHLKLTISGGTSLLPEVAKSWTKLTGCTITEGYGLTETSPVAFFNTPGYEEIGTIGKPVKDTEIDIRDKDGNSVDLGKAGELLIKGPQVMKGYWQRPEATREAFTEDGFFKTGDVAVKQKNGNYKIVDRLKDMILVSGFNVYPNEIEAVLVSHDNVLEAAIIGGPSRKTGEEVLAFVTVSEFTNIDDLMAFCRENLTAYKVPKKITILEELPKSTVGKILRRKLRVSQ
jgi:long-chain acyl-CoA synthetase